jgi:hypothetical protein
MENEKIASIRPIGCLVVSLESHSSHRRGTVVWRLLSGGGEMPGHMTLSLPTEGFFAPR